MAINRQPMSDQELAEYLQERASAQEMKIDPHSDMRKEARRSDIQNHKYNPLRWRG